MANPNTRILGKLGKRPVRFDRRTLRLSKYIKAVMPPPKKKSLVQKVHNWGMMLNDNIGNCTIATAGHMVQQVTTYASTQHLIPDSEILKAYEVIGGYVPGDPSTDNGCYVLDVLKYWRKKGIGGHKIHAFAALDVGNMTQLKQAIAIFGNVYIGIELPATAQEQDQCWSVVPDAGDTGMAGSWGGHAIPGMMYDPAGPNSAGEHQDSTIGIISWGKLMWMTTSFYKTYASEAYAILTTDFLQANHKTPTGFNMGELESDLHQITH